MECLEGVHMQMPVWSAGAHSAVPGCCRRSPVSQASLLPLHPHPRSWLYLALQQPPWSPHQHHRFLPAFQEATATLLLVAHRSSRQAGRRGSGGGSGGGCSGSAAGAPLAALLGLLPPELLLHILGLAAYPLSAWASLELASPCTCPHHEHHVPVSAPHSPTSSWWPDICSLSIEERESFRQQLHSQIWP